MIFGNLFEKFIEESPVSVMVKVAMEKALAPELLDTLFEKTTRYQYTRELLFSSVVDLMAMVACKARPSIHAAYQKAAERLPVSLAAVYAKLNGLEPALCTALVRHVSSQFEPVIRAMVGQLPAWLPGYRFKIIDGNHFSATERRLKVTRQSQAGPLPGQCLVVLDPALMLALEVIPCEDGHAQERSLTEQILALVQPQEIWIEDRNFCTHQLLEGIAGKQAFFIVRHHGSMTAWRALSEPKDCGRIETGKVFSQEIQLTGPESRQHLKLRRITVELDKPTREGDTHIYLLTNLPESVASEIQVAEGYRCRWTLETLFQEVTVNLCCEIKTLGYPRAALFSFSVALVAYNILSLVKAALRAQYGHKKIEEEVSSYYLAEEVSSTYRGMMIAIPEAEWHQVSALSAAKIAEVMLQLAAKVRLPAFRKHPRGPKKPVPPRNQFVGRSHVATSRLLAEASAKKKSL